MSILVSESFCSNVSLTLPKHSHLSPAPASSTISICMTYDDVRTHTSWPGRAPAAARASRGPNPPQTTLSLFTLYIGPVTTSAGQGAASDARNDAFFGGKYSYTFSRPGGGTGRSLVPRAFASPRATHTGYWLPLVRPTLPRPARRSAAWIDDIHDTSAPISHQSESE
eukprot:scaffold12774_cov153-Isochrysis_galbana.AAC.2